MRHVFTAEERSRGGKTRAAQPSFVLACQKGFERTCETHPFYARKWLRKRIKTMNAAKRAAA